MFHFLLQRDHAAHLADAHLSMEELGAMIRLVWSLFPYLLVDDFGCIKTGLFSQLWTPLL